MISSSDIRKQLKVELVNLDQRSEEYKVLLGFLNELGHEEMSYVQKD